MSRRVLLSFRESVRSSRPRIRPFKATVALPTFETGSRPSAMAPFLTRLSQPPRLADAKKRGIKTAIFWCSAREIVIFDIL
jgi:hypothetical protein